jgi:hypothetical protein
VALADTRQATIEQPNPDPNYCNPTGEWQLLAAFCLMRATKVQLTMFEVWPPSQRHRGEWCLAYFESLHTSLRTTPQHNKTQHNTRLTYFTSPLFTPQPQCNALCQSSPSAHFW